METSTRVLRGNLECFQTVSKSIGERVQTQTVCFLLVCKAVGGVDCFRAVVLDLLVSVALVQPLSDIMN